jgi:hypothetical protein
MVKAAFKGFVHVALVVIIANVAGAVGQRIWPDYKERPPREIFGLAVVGAFGGMYLFYMLGMHRIFFSMIDLCKSRKTDPVIGPPPAPMKTHEEWKKDLDQIDGQGSLDEFLAKWSEVPRTKKGEAAKTIGIAGNVGPSGASQGREIPNQPGLPPDVVGWIDKHYERAAQLWSRAHPGQDFPNPRR